MKAILIDNYGGPEKMQLAEVPVPRPQAGEVLIRIHSAGVNPVDWKIREGYLKKRLTVKFPLILGWDASGEVVALGEGVCDFTAHDPVYAFCRKPVVQWGTFADYVAIEARYVAKMPVNLSYAQAAAVPLAGLTAWQSLFDFCGLKKGQTVLIHAGGGGVGSFAIQFAKYTGAIVLTTASKQKIPYVMEFGADVVIDYANEDFLQRVKELYPQGVDAILDTVGGETLEKSWGCVRKGGSLVTICDFKIDLERGKELGIHAGFVFVEANGKQLREIAYLIEEGRIVVPGIQEFPLERAADALETIRLGHTQGKIVLVLCQT